MKRWLILSVVSGLVVSGAATAAVQQGDTELDALGAWMTQNGADDGMDVDSLFLMARLGYFLTDNIQVSGAAIGAWNEFEMAGAYVIDEEEVSASADLDVDLYGLGGGVKYHFMPTNQWVPYIGAQVLWVDADVDADFTVTFEEGEGTTTETGGESLSADGVLWGPVAGLRYELNAYNDFFVEYQYHMWSGDIDEVIDDGHGLFVGLIHQFK